MGEINPLTNKVVLHKLTELCSLKMLPAFRLVCWDWYVASMAKWRTNKSITVFPEDEPGKPTRRLTVSKFIQVIEELNFFHGFDTRSYHTMICKDWKIRQKVDEGISNIWKHCGPGLTRLELHDILLKDEKILQQIVYEFTPNLQVLIVDNVHVCNLKEYSMELVPTPENEKVLQTNLTSVEYYGSHKPRPLACYYPAIRINWKNFFYKFPNLQNIVIGQGSEKTFEAFVEGLENAMEHGHLTKLRYMDTRKAIYELSKHEGEVYHQLLTRLCNLHLPVTNLAINVGYKSEIGDMALVFASHQSVTKLHVCRYIEPPIQTFRFDVIPQTLTDLNLEGSTFANFEFLKYTPNLKRLRVRIANYGETGMEIVGNDEVADSIRLVHLEEFVYRTVRPMSVTGLERIMRWTENGKLTKLGIAFTPITFRFMCERMGHLEWLSLFGNSLDVEDCVGIVNGVQVHPNITWLKRLKGIEKCNFFIREGLLRLFGIDLFEKDPDE